MKYGLDLTLNEIDSDADCAAVVDRFLPGLRDKLGQNPQARGLSLRKLAQYTGGLIPQQALDALDKALQELGRSAGGYTAAEKGQRFCGTVRSWSRIRRAQRLRGGVCTHGKMSDGSRRPPQNITRTQSNPANRSLIRKENGFRRTAARFSMKTACITGTARTKSIPTAEKAARSGPSASGATARKI